MQEKSCYVFSEISRDDVQLAGGKGANLGDMAQAGLPVPSGFVICAPAYRHIVEQCRLDVRIKDFLSNLDYNSADQLKEAEREIRRLFEDIPIHDDLRQMILAQYHAFGKDVRVAVRSSATAEDLAGASFAGQQETVLNVIGEEALLGAVRRCWSSLYTSQALFYRWQKGFDSSSVSMALVVQRMIDSEKSGVVFTVDPILSNRFNMIIEAVWGLGEGIVSGAITPDHYKVDRETYEIVFESVPKKPLMFCQTHNGIAKMDVPPDKVSARVLTNNELKQLVDIGTRIEKHFGSPQDIEWAIAANELSVLQSRPITCL